MSKCQIEIIYNGAPTTIQCNSTDKMKDICRKFLDKIKKKDILYSYNGKIGIDEDKTFEEFANPGDKERKKMSIVAFENEIDPGNEESDIIKSKNIICPECKETISIDISDYKINLYGCKNGHKFENILLDEFEETQNIDRTKIICDICKQKNQSTTSEHAFYLCLTCNKKVCPLCKSNHDPRHKIINYDDKFYYCTKHYENYISFCEKCKMNLCSLCDEHKDHKKKIFIDIAPNKEKLIEKKNLLKRYAEQFNKEINKIIDILNEVKNKMNLYYKINEDIINNYDNKNKNYENIDYLNKFLKNNIHSELQNIFECDTIVDEFNNIFNIYKKMNIDEINIIYNTRGSKEIRLFGVKFVDRYKKCCKLIIGGKDIELKDKYSFGLFSNKKEKLEIKLKGITNITNMSYMFYNCSSLQSLPDISKWNTSNVNNMRSMFNSCFSLQPLPDISKWNTSNVNNMSHMFSSCLHLQSLPDISKWNTTNTTDMREIFSYCSSLQSLPDISKWNTSIVNDMSSMLCCCSSLQSLPDISKWNISNVNNMSHMFYECSSLQSLPDISKWNTSNVENLYNMFSGCGLLKSIPDFSK